MRRWCLALTGVVALLTAACGGGGSGSSSGSPPHGNVLQVGAPREPTSLDPAASIAYTNDQYFALYDTLINTNPKTHQLEPGLATSWSFQGADRLTFRLNLRPGVKFQDGTVLDANAVKTSLDHYRQLHIFTDLDAVGSVQAVSSSVVDIHLASPYSPLPYVLSYRAGMIVSPTAMQKYGKDFGTHPVGAGPFMFKSWQSGSELDLVKFPGYWKRGQPKLNGITFKYITNPSSLASAIQGKQVDVAGPVIYETTNLPALRANSDLNVILAKDFGGIAQIQMNATKEPFNNPLVRRAVNLSLNRGDIRKAAVGNEGLGVASQIVPPTSFAYSKDLKGYPYDPAQAKQLLAQAGYPNGIKAQLCVGTTFPLNAPQVEKRDLAAAGIDVSIDVVQGNGCVAKLTAGTTSMVQLGYPGSPDPYTTYTGLVGPGNLSRGTYEGVSPLLDKAARAYTQADQKPVYDQLNRVVYDQAPLAPLYYLVDWIATSKSVTGVATDIQGNMLLNNVSFSAV